MTREGQGLPQVAESPRYQALIRRRGRLTTVLAAVMIAAYLGFIFLVAFGRTLLAQPLVPGGATTLGIPIGLGLILLAILLTGIYVRRATRDFDGEVTAIGHEFGA